MLRFALIFLVALAASSVAAADFVFRNVGDSAGLFPALDGVMGHGAGWGDVDGDGWVDLYVGTFQEKEGKPNRLLRNVNGKFTLDPQPAPQLAGRMTGVVFADLDNDGDMDLYVGSMPKAEKGLVGCRLLRNDGQGKFTDISAESGACPEAFGGRSVAVLDFDGDGRLDLLVGEDPMPRYNGSTTRSSRLFRNLGKLKFDDVTQRVGIPAGIPGLGVAAGDFNNDTWPDLFIACHQGGNALFLNDGQGNFRELAGSRERFAWKDSGGDNMICGVCCGDVNRDGRLDLVLGQHYDHPWRDPVPNRLYLNRGVEKGMPKFEDVTQAVGLTPLKLKAPHVEIQDFDNDGWPDISTSFVLFADGAPHPVIFKNLGVQGDLPRFRAAALGVNDFPNADDLKANSNLAFFEKMVERGKATYMAAGPSADFDRDGRLDLFLASWWPEQRSLLLKNETPGGHWLQVAVRGRDQLNRMGVGARVNLYPAGKLGDPAALLGCKEIAVGFGYASGQPPLAHFGLGPHERVDLEVIFPHGAGQRELRNITADQRVTVEE